MIDWEQLKVCVHGAYVGESGGHTFVCMKCKDDKEIDRAREIRLKALTEEKKP